MAPYEMCNALRAGVARMSAEAGFCQEECGGIHRVGKRHLSVS